MGTRVEASSGVPDVFKWAVAVIVIGAAVVGFYVYAEQSLLLRVVVLLVAVGITVAILYHTERGRLAWGFLRDARNEVRKVVWPTRRETGQTTLIVIAVVAVVGIMLWGFDGVLTYAMRLLLGTGS